jgi:hypothetical protein
MGRGMMMMIESLPLSALAAGRLAVFIHPFAPALALDGHVGAFLSIVPTRHQCLAVGRHVPGRIDQPFQYAMGRISGSDLGDTGVAVNTALTGLSAIGQHILWIVLAFILLLPFGTPRFLVFADNGGSVGKALVGIIFRLNAFSSFVGAPGENR